MTDKWIETDSGIIYPEEKSKPNPKRKLEYGCLELQFQLSREEANKAFTTLMNLPEAQGRFSDKEKGWLLSKLIRNLATIMLGDDWDCEILC